MIAKWKAKNIHGKTYTKAIGIIRGRGYVEGIDTGEFTKIEHIINEEEFFYGVAESLEVKEIECDDEYQSMINRLKQSNKLSRILELKNDISKLEEIDFYERMKDTFEEPNNDVLKKCYKELLEIINEER